MVPPPKAKGLMVKCSVFGEMVPFDKEHFSGSMLKRGPHNNKLACRRHAPSSASEIKCHGPCNKWKPADKFTKSGRRREDPVCEVCMVWVTEVPRDTGTVPQAPPGELAAAETAVMSSVALTGTVVDPSIDLDTAPERSVATMSHRIAPGQGRTPAMQSEALKTKAVSAFSTSNKHQQSANKLVIMNLESLGSASVSTDRDDDTTSVGTLTSTSKVDRMGRDSRVHGASDLLTSRTPSIAPSAAPSMAPSGRSSTMTSSMVLDQGKAAWAKIPTNRLIPGRFQPGKHDDRESAHNPWKSRRAPTLGARDEYGHEPLDQFSGSESDDDVIAINKLTI